MKMKSASSACDLFTGTSSSSSAPLNNRAFARHVARKSRARRSSLVLPKEKGALKKMKVVHHGEQDGGAVPDAYTGGAAFDLRHQEDETPHVVIQHEGEDCCLDEDKPANDPSSFFLSSNFYNYFEGEHCASLGSDGLAVITEENSLEAAEEDAYDNEDFELDSFLGATSEQENEQDQHDKQLPDSDHDSKQHQDQLEPGSSSSTPHDAHEAPTSTAEQQPGGGFCFYQDDEDGASRAEGEQDELETETINSISGTSASSGFGRTAELVSWTAVTSGLEMRVNTDPSDDPVEVEVDNVHARDVVETGGKEPKEVGDGIGRDHTGALSSQLQEAEQPGDPTLLESPAGTSDVETASQAHERKRAHFEDDAIVQHDVEADAMQQEVDAAGREKPQLAEQEPALVAAPSEPVRDESSPDLVATDLDTNTAFVVEGDTKITSPNLDASGAAAEDIRLGQQPEGEQDQQVEVVTREIVENTSTAVAVAVVPSTPERPAGSKLVAGGGPDHAERTPSPSSSRVHKVVPPPESVTVTNEAIVQLGGVFGTDFRGESESEIEPVGHKEIASKHKNVKSKITVLSPEIYKKKEAKAMGVLRKHTVEATVNFFHELYEAVGDGAAGLSKHKHGDPRPKTYDEKMVEKRVLQYQMAKRRLERRSRMERSTSLVPPGVDPAAWGAYLQRKEESALKEKNRREELYDFDNANAYREVLRARITQEAARSRDHRTKAYTALPSSELRELEKFETSNRSRSLGQVLDVQRRSPRGGSRSPSPQRDGLPSGGKRALPGLSTVDELATPSPGAILPPLSASPEPRRRGARNMLQQQEKTPSSGLPTPMVPGPSYHTELPKIYESAEVKLERMSMQLDKRLQRCLLRAEKPRRLKPLTIDRLSETRLTDTKDMIASHIAQVEKAAARPARSHASPMMQGNFSANHPIYNPANYKNL
ncbi:unnamed protein product [Amoebophrya sp. A25]|nr:unnamed protein product [Amoebophrya sp. A25]|eukprot:GSA25T00011871001.1